MTNLKYIRFFLLFQFSLLLTFSACREDAHFRPDNNNADNRQTKTQNVVVVIVDGPRFTEGWGDSTKKYIPLMAGNMAKNGVVNTMFYNNGDTPIPHQVTATIAYLMGVKLEDCNGEVMKELFVRPRNEIGNKGNFSNNNNNDNIL